MSAATFNGFDRATVLDWARPRLKTRKKAKRSEQWFWLERQQANKLIDDIRKTHGEYWADAALIQYGCGFRPEELPLLQTRGAQVSDGKAKIAVYTSSNKYGLKTDRSHDALSCMAGSFRKGGNYGPGCVPRSFHPSVSFIVCFRWL
jgi:hypothetical protein